MRRDPAKARAWQARSVKKARENQQRRARDQTPRERPPRAPLPALSASRRAELPERTRVRTAALARAGHRCEVPELVPDIRCAFYGDRGLEVDEIRGGSWRKVEWLDLDRVVVLCPAHHDYKGSHKRLYRVLIGDPPDGIGPPAFRTPGWAPPAR